jgi:hypothetical protein
MPPSSAQSIVSQLNLTSQTLNARLRHLPSRADLIARARFTPPCTWSPAKVSRGESLRDLDSFSESDARTRVSPPPTGPDTVHLTSNESPAASSGRHERSFRNIGERRTDLGIPQSEILKEKDPVRRADR